MGALPAFIMRGRPQAMLVAATAAVLALLLPPITSPLGYLGGAVIALVSLRRGASEGLLIMAGAAAIAGVLGAILLGHGRAVVLATLVLWLPCWLLSLVLRSTTSMARTLEAAAMLGLLLVGLVYLLLGDPTAWWIEVLTPLLGPALEQGGMAGDSTDIIASAAGYMTGMAAAALVLGLMICLLLARAWQAGLYNPGGFRSEFHGLRLGRNAALLAIVLVLLARLGGDLGGGQVAAVASQLMLVMLVVFVLAGLGLVHFALAHTGRGRIWRVGLYVLLLLIAPQMSALLATVGVLDAWLDLRRHLLNITGGGGS